ncbi:hypothetical protein C8R45DRAFT_1107280 [Mycena sanguinolenta]|nr:hypothetical protein C8R45DRAFT_1107280 [Mycena sanguinolenta]
MSFLRSLFSSGTGRSLGASLLRVRAFHIAQRGAKEQHEVDVDVAGTQAEARPGCAFLTARSEILAQKPAQRRRDGDVWKKTKLLPIHSSELLAGFTLERALMLGHVSRSIFLRAALYVSKLLHTTSGVPADASQVVGTPIDGGSECMSEPRQEIASGFRVFFWLPSFVPPPPQVPTHTPSTLRCVHGHGRDPECRARVVEGKKGDWELGVAAMLVGSLTARRGGREDVPRTEWQGLQDRCGSIRQRAPKRAAPGSTICSSGGIERIVEPLHLLKALGSLCPDTASASAPSLPSQPARGALSATGTANAASRNAHASNGRRVSNYEAGVVVQLDVDGRQPLSLSSIWDTPTSVSPLLRVHTSTRVAPSLAIFGFSESAICSRIALLGLPFARPIRDFYLTPTPHQAFPGPTMRLVRAWRLRQSEWTSVRERRTIPSTAYYTTQQCLDILVHSANRARSASSTYQRKGGP